MLRRGEGSGAAGDNKEQKIVAQHDRLRYYDHGYGWHLEGESERHILV